MFRKHHRRWRNDNFAEFDALENTPNLEIEISNNELMVHLWRRRQNQLSLQQLIEMTIIHRQAHEIVGGQRSVFGNCLGNHLLFSPLERRSSRQLEGTWREDRIIKNSSNPPENAPMQRSRRR